METPMSNINQIIAQMQKFYFVSKYYYRHK